MSCWSVCLLAACGGRAWPRPPAVADAAAAPGAPERNHVPRAGVPPVDAPLSPEARARALVASLVGGHFEDVTRELDTKVAATLSSARLSEAWSESVGAAGAYEDVAGVDEAEGRTATVVTVRCRFERGELPVRVTYDASGRVAGLWFMPLTTPWHAPAYVDRGAFDEIAIDVGAPVDLSATLTMPKGKGPFAAVVLVHGSGPNDRDESGGGSKLFKDLAWGLASRGVAVLRYDKRTVVHWSRDFQGKAFTLDDETTRDARAAAGALVRTPGVDPSRVYVVGHSLGAALAPRVAAGERAVAGVVMLAGPARPIDVTLPDQIRYLCALQGCDPPTLSSKLRTLEAAFTAARAPGDPGEVLDALVADLPRSYLSDLIGYDAVGVARAYPKPMVILQGGRDYQVTVDDDFAIWRKALGARKNVAFRLYPPLNHHFIAGEGRPSPAEYARPGHAPARLVDDLASWVKSGRLPRER